MAIEVYCSFIIATTNMTRLALTTSRDNLQRLIMIRWLGSIALLICLAYTHWGLKLPLDYPFLIGVLAVLMVINLLSEWRGRKPWPVTDLEFFLQLLTDILAISLFLYATGGASNPFVSYFLIPITIAAALLPWRYTTLVSLAAVLAYSTLLFYNQPLPALMPAEHGHHPHGIAPGFNLHVLGMWVNFALSALLITFFVVRMAQALRQQQQSMAQMREDTLHHEQLLSVATLAAGTAHELGTPLNTMTILVEELQHRLQQSEDSDSQQDLQLLRQQLLHCKAILERLVNTANQHSHSENLAIPFNDFMQKLLDQWSVIRPRARWQWQPSDSEKQPLLPDQLSLNQAICHLLDNAADASDEPIEISQHWDEQTITLSIRDHGEGIDPGIADQLGKPFISRKEEGLGLGLFLSHATIERLGGQIRLYNHRQGGTLVEVTLPVNGNHFDKP